MNRQDMDFFHQATMRICGSLDAEKVLADCMDFLKDYMPVNTMQLCIYNENTNSIGSIAMVFDSQGNLFGNNFNVKLSREARDHIENFNEETSQIIGHPKEHPVGKLVWEKLGKPDMSGITLHLGLDDDKLGVLSVFSHGFDMFEKEHARLLELLHDPFAVALANTLKHQEIVKLKDMLADDNRFLSRQLHRISGDEIVGSRFGLMDVMEGVRQVAPLSSHVLLLGETGVGKEVIANSIHYSSPRAGGPYIKVNCGAIPETLIDSELFGHEKGAFSGAVSRKRGRFERADGGTLFLDEIGELPLQAQVRLLRVIQSREIERVGGSAPITVDIRIIAATHRNLEQMVREGKFREDLWFRLNVFPITVPPLRHRTTDIPALVIHFIERKSREMNLGYIPSPAPGEVERLQGLSWPGNVRELENMVERALIRNISLGTGEMLYFDAPGPVTAPSPDFVPEDTSESVNLDEAIAKHIRRILNMASGKVQGKDGAAALLGIHPSTLRNRMKKLNIPYGRSGKSF